MSDGLANGYDLKLPLEKIKPHPTHIGKVLHWLSCAPFIENKHGTLIHRPRTGTTYNIHKTPHIGFHFWCGMSVTGDDKKFKFLFSPPEGRILCERCEAIATSKGPPSADELAGKHVHKGRTVAVVTCCEEKP